MTFLASSLPSGFAAQVRANTLTASAIVYLTTQSSVRLRGSLPVVFLLVWASVWVAGIEILLQQVVLAQPSPETQIVQPEYRLGRTTALASTSVELATQVCSIPEVETRCLWSHQQSVRPASDLVAQIVLPTPNDTGTILTPNGAELEISGGRLSGDNATLFHRFEQFGLSSAQIATFLATPGLQNILAQVVGSQPSLIDGMIRVTNGSPHLFLVNPAGIIFGSNARLDVPGSFTATTATALQFSNNQWFDVLGANTYSSFLGNPIDFGFHLNTPGTIVNAGQLAVSANQRIALLGSPTLNLGTLTAPDGQIAVVSVPGNTILRLSQPSSLLSLQITAIDPNSLIPLPPVGFNPSTLAQLLTGGGDISNASGLSLDINGDVQLTGSGLVVRSITGDTVLSGEVSVSPSPTPSPTPNGQQILVQGEQLQVAGTTVQTGNTTQVTLQAGQNMAIQTLNGTALNVTGGSAATIVLNAAGNLSSSSSDAITAPSQNLNINATHVSLGTLNTSSSTGLAAGGVTLNVTGDLTIVALQAAAILTTGETGNGGSVTLNAGGNITIGDLVTATLTSVGNAANGGAIQINAANVTSANLSSFSQTTTGNAANGGAIQINAANVLVDVIQSFTAANNGNAASAGTIQINTSTGNIQTGELAAYASAVGQVISGSLVRLQAVGDITAIGPIRTFANSASSSANAGSVSLTVGANRSVQIGADAGGSIDATASGAGNAGVISIIADRVNWAGRLNGSRLELQPATQSRNLAIGSSNSSALSLSTLLLGRLHNGVQAIILGRSDSTGTVALNSAASFTAPVTLAGGQRLIGPDRATTWQITGSNQGSLSGYPQGLNFQQIENLTGGSNNDTFQFQPGGRITGQIHGGAGTNQLDFTALSTAITINLALQTSTQVGSIRNIQSVQAGTGNNTLIGANTTNTWRITNRDRGSINNNFTFSNFQNLEGGSGSDTFLLSNRVIFPGNINGGGGNNTLDQSDWNTDLTLNLATNQITGVSGLLLNIQNFVGGTGNNTVLGKNTSNTWQIVGTTSGQINNGTNITRVNHFQNWVGGTGNNTLIGANTNNIWQLAGNNTGVVNNTLRFQGMQNLTGGSGDDLFVFADLATISGIIDGGDGFNVLDYRAYTPPIVAVGDRFTGTGGTRNIQSVIFPPSQSEQVSRDLTNVVITTTPPTNLPLPQVTGLEERFTSEFERYLERNLPAVRRPQEFIAESIQRVQQQTQVRPAILYISFVPAWGNNLDSRILQLARRSDDILQISVVTADGAISRRRLTDVSRKQLEQTLQKFRSELIDPLSQDYLEGAQQLYQWFIAPIEAQLQAKGIDNLVFIMDSGLRSIPLAALHDGQQFLIEKYSLGLMPSFSLTDTTHVNLRESRVLAMGASLFQEQIPLPAVPLELSFITEQLWSGRSFLNEQFTIDQLKQARKQEPFKIIHLATHAEFLSGAASNSYIQLWNDRLQLNELDNLGLDNPPVELLVLSACRTAMGDEFAELGFAGLALQAGVRTTLASLWYVSDAGTLGLMIEFYRQLRTAPTRAEALRQAQLAMLRKTINFQNDQLRLPATPKPVAVPPELLSGEQIDLSHPYYWAGFTMVGNPW